MHCLRDKTVLLIEDDAEVRDNLAYYLKSHVGCIHSADDASSALEIVHRWHPDLILADIELPGEDGLQLISQLRKEGHHTPIIVLTGHNQKSYLLRALPLKLEAYLLKPITSGQLLLTLSELCQRTIQECVLVDEPAMIYSFVRKQVRREGRWIALSHMEIGLLELLIQEKGTVVSHQRVESHLYPDREMSANALRSLVRKLRAKLTGVPLRTVAGQGYLLEREEKDAKF